MSPEQYGQHATQTLGAYNEIGERLKSKFPQVQSASPGYFDVNVKSGRQTEDYVAQLQNSQRDPDALHQEFYGYRPAIQRFKEYTGENQPYYFQSGDGPPPAPAGATGQQGYACPAALAATGAGLLGAGTSDFLVRCSYPHKSKIRNSNLTGDLHRETNIFSHFASIGTCSYKAPSLRASEPLKVSYRDCGKCLTQCTCALYPDHQVARLCYPLF